jgi:hypothetical protein
MGHKKRSLKGNFMTQKYYYERFLQVYIEVIHKFCMQRP